VTAADPSGHRMVFICGLHRSGTSLLHRCIGGHPATSAFANTGVDEDEGQHLQNVYPVDGQHGGPGRFGFQPSARLTEASDLVDDDKRARLFDQWSRYWDLSKSHLVEKSPPNLIRMRFLQAMFPGAQFIVLLRHPIAVSYATGKWSNTRFHNLIHHWLVCHKIMLEDLPHLQQALLLRYEDFVREPECSLARIWSFLDLPPHHPNEEVQTAVNDHYYAQYESLQKLNSVRWLYYRLTRLRYEAACVPFGYTLKPSDYVSSSIPIANERPNTPSSKP